MLMLEKKILIFPNKERRKAKKAQKADVKKAGEGSKKRSVNLHKLNLPS